MKRVSILIIISLWAAGAAFAEGEKNIGAHIKVSLFDYTYGIHEKAGLPDYSTQSNGFGLMGVMLYFFSNLNENVSLDFQPLFSAVTGATPIFGSAIGAQRSAAGGVTLKFSGIDWGKAVVKVLLPEGYELSGGILKPRFTMDYGAEMFWEDEISGGKFSINDNLGRMQSAGIEAVKTYDIGEFNIPVYLYIMNGETNFLDNNNQPMGMIHAEPAYGPLRLTGSFAAGRYDAGEILGMTRWSGGFILDLDILNIRAEYAGGKWEKGIAGVRAATPYGYYAKAFIKLASWIKLMYHYDYVSNNFSGFTSFTAGPGEIYQTNTPGVIINVYDTLLQFKVDIANWYNTDGTDRLLFTRTVLGWRATF